MTGFVDPAFKRVNVTEPNFIIWRLSKWFEGNHEVKQIGRQCYANFYDEDTYIVYSSTPVKKVPGRANRGPRKMEIHIHFWLGSRAPDDDCRRTVIKVMELDEVLEGAGTLHKEMQGYESSRFLSYFKQGMFITRGQIVSVTQDYCFGFENEGTDVESRNRFELGTKLYALTRRASTLILTEQPSTCWKFMNSSSILVLDKGYRVFIWIGKHVSLEERHLVFQVEKMMEANNSNRKIVWVFDGKEGELAQGDLTHFEEVLRLDLKIDESLEPVDKHLLLCQSKFRNITKLYKVVEGNCKTITHVKDGPLDQSDLDSMDICIIDHCMNGLWVWVSKKVTNEEKSWAINVANSYMDEKFQCNTEEERKINVHRVVEGSEPQEFKLLFKSWIDSFSVYPDHYFLKKQSWPVNKKFTAETLEDSPFLAAEAQLLDLGGGKVSVARVEKDKLVRLDPEDFGIFHCKYKYLVCYTYEVNGTEKKILYYWMGNKLSVEERTDIWFNVKYMSEYKDVNVRVRIEQYKETPHFCAIFLGKIVILNSPLPLSKDNKTVLDKYPLLLLKVSGGHILNTRSIEVTPAADSLSSDNVYILRTPYLSFVWCGANSEGDEREIAKGIANKWTKHYEVVIEGYESNHFRMFEYKFFLGVGTGRKEIVPAQITVPATLYICYPSTEGLRVSEVLNFDSSDLGSSDIVILDAWNIIFIWIGEDVTDGCSLKATQIVMNYLQTDPCGRAKNLPIIYVSQNQEPPIFRGFFPTWYKAGEKTSSEAPEGEHHSDSQPKGNYGNLSAYEFWRKFGVKREVFNQYPRWKQRKLEKFMGF